MTTKENKDPKKPSNPNYKDSAVNLTNSPEVKGLLNEWLASKKAFEEAQAAHIAKLEEQPELPEAVKEREAWNMVMEARKNLESAIKEFGGYQDVELGLYALQQVRKSVTYDPELVKVTIPKYADKILCQVDGAVLKGLLKGKLITQEQVEQCSITKESVRFVIEAMEVK